jgi:hypothetical protein
VAKAEKLMLAGKKYILLLAHKLKHDSTVAPDWGCDALRKGFFASDAHRVPQRTEISGNLPQVRTARHRMGYDNILRVRVAAARKTHMQGEKRWIGREAQTNTCTAMQAFLEVKPHKGKCIRTKNQQQQHKGLLKSR